MHVAPDVGAMSGPLYTFFKGSWLVTKFFGCYISKGGGMHGGCVYVPCVSLGAGCMWLRVRIDVGTKVFVQRCPYDGLGRSRCVNGVICM